MYKYFRTNDDLFRNQLVRKIEEKGRDPVAQILGLFDGLDEWFHEPNFRSCMFIKATGDYPERGQPVNNIAAEHINYLATIFANLS